MLVLRSAPMMFDWSDQDQVCETIWGEFNESGDHTVPYPKDTEEYQVFSFDAFRKKRRNDDTNTISQSTGQNSGAKNDFPGCNLENSSSPNTNEDHSGPRLDMDMWPDLPSLNAELSTGELSSLNKSFSSIAGEAAQLDGESELFSNAREDKENDSFLDCDWANIGDFDDLDRIFRNESIYGHDMVTNVDEFISSSVDMIGSTVQSIPMPDIPLSRDQSSDQGCSSFQLVEHSGGKRKTVNKTADTVETREQAFCQTPDSNQLSGKDDRKKKLLKSRKKAEERSKNKASQILSGPWPQNLSQNQQFPGQNVNPFHITPSHAVLSPALAQQSKVGDAEPMENIGPSSHFMYSQYGYPVYPFPGISVLQHVQPDKNRMNDVPIGHNLYRYPLKYSNTSNVVPELQIKQLAMSPQKKIEKLRRRQQARAMLAIQQQQQQFGDQIIGSKNTASEENSQRNKGKDAVNSDVGLEENETKLPPLGLNLLVHDSAQRISTLTDDNSLERTIYYQLQDSLRKLDTRVRLCIRDSLFRLARSSVERQTESDRSSTNKSTRDEREVPVNEEANSFKRYPRLPDAETYTNPIDRTVAHLLFHRPLESSTGPTNDEMPQSSILHNPVSKLPLNIPGSMSEGEPESYGEMDMQPSESK